MKKTAIIVVLIWALFVAIIFPYRKSAEAIGDPMTLTQISGLAYALGSSFGLDFNMSGVTPEGTNRYMENEINKWLGGSSIIEKFGAETARIAAGKLIIPSILYNGIKEFISNFVDENNINTSEKNIVYANGGNQFYALANITNSSGKQASAWSVYNISTGETRIVTTGYFGTWQTPVNDGIAIVSGQVVGRWHSDGNPNMTVFLAYASGTTMESVGASLNGEIPETVLNPDEQWTGTIGGQDWPDTNLDQLIGQIYDDVADNNLDVEGEVGPIDPPPTPVPTVVPGDIDGYWNRQSEQLEGLGNDIGDISGKLDDLGQQAGNISDALEGVNQGIQSQTGVISGALDQAAQDVVDAIGEQTGVLDESLTQTAEGVQEIADTLQPGEIEPQQFDLRRLFPFCIPFDIHNLLQKFNAEPVAPHVQLPFVIQSIGFSYMF